MTPSPSERAGESSLDDRHAFSRQLESWLAGDEPKTVGSLRAAFAEKSFAVTVLVLMFVPALPAPTGGITHLFEIATMGLGIQMVAGRRVVWLPSRWQQRDLGTAITLKTVPFVLRRVRALERVSRPRLTAVFRGSVGWRVQGGLVFVFALAAALAPPFTGLDTLPSIGAMVVALAIVLEDFVLLTIGFVTGAAGVLLVALAGVVVWEAVGHLL